RPRANRRSAPGPDRAFEVCRHRHRRGARRGRRRPLPRAREVERALSAGDARGHSRAALRDQAMAYLNHDFPQTEVLLRERYLYDGDPSRTGFRRAVWFGVTAIHGQPLLFHSMIDDGAVFARLPVSAFCWKEAPERPLDFLEIWNCPSYHLTVAPWDWLSGLRCEVFLKDRSTIEGEYVTTIDFAESEEAESPGDIGWKSKNVVRLVDGNFAWQPHHRIRFHEPALATRPVAPDYRVNTRRWHVENTPQWRPTDEWAYRFEEKP